MSLFNPFKPGVMLSIVNYWSIKVLPLNIAVHKHFQNAVWIKLVIRETIYILAKKYLTFHL